MRRQASDSGSVKQEKSRALGELQQRAAKSAVSFIQQPPLWLYYSTPCSGSLLYKNALSPFPAGGAPSYSSFKAQLSTTSSRQPSMSLMNHSSTTTVPTVPCSIHSYALLPPSLDCQSL